MTAQSTEKLVPANFAQKTDSQGFRWDINQQGSIDDGTNSGYSTEGSAGFPVLHAAPLDRPGSVKGGPYSHGTFSEAGQYGKVEVTDDGGQIVQVRLSGHRWDGTELVALDLEFAATDR